MTTGAEVDGNESQPDDTRGVHGESNEFRLVEGLWDFSSQNSVDGADDDQKDRIGKCDHIRCIRRGLAKPKKEEKQ